MIHGLEKDNPGYLIDINEHKKSYDKNILFKTSQAGDYKRGRYNQIASSYSIISVIYKTNDHYIVNEENIFVNRSINTNQNLTHYNINVYIKLSLNNQLSDKTEYEKLTKKFKNFDNETSIPKYFQGQSRSFQLH